MFDWFKNKDKQSSNVVPFPEPEEAQYVPEPEKPATTFYRLGLTDNNRISLQMGYSEITMNKIGAENFIQQLELFISQLNDDGDSQ